METRPLDLEKLNYRLPATYDDPFSIDDTMNRLRQKPIIWIFGPAGNGKKSAVNQYISACKIPCLWYTVKNGDAESDDILRRLIAGRAISPARGLLGLHYLCLKTGRWLPAFSPDHFNSFADRSTSQGMIVLDGYHEISPGSPLQDIIDQWPPSRNAALTLLLITRDPPPSALCCGHTSPDMAVLDWNAPRFDILADAGQFMYRPGQDVVPERWLPVQGPADGWITGILLMALKSKSTGSNGFPTNLESTRMIHQITDNLFRKITPAVQDFMLKTALLPWMTDRTAEKLTGDPRAARYIAGLDSASKPIEKIFQSISPYRYQPVLKRFLVARARKTLSKSELARFLHRAARILEEDGQTDAAVDLLGQINDLKAITGLILKNASDLDARGRWDLLGKWLKLIPEDRRRKNPWLLYWTALCQLPFHPARVRPQLEKVFEQFQADKNPSGVFQAWAAIVDAVIFDFNRFSLLRPWLDRYKSITREFGPPPSPDIEARVVSSLMLAHLFTHPVRGQILHWTARASALAECISDNSLKLCLFHRLALCRLLMGDLTETDYFLHRAQKILHSNCASPLSQVNAFFVKAFYQLLTGCPEECIKTASTGLGLARRTGVHLLDSLFQGLSILCTLNAGDLKKAESLLDRMAGTVRLKKSCEASHYFFLRSRTALSGRDLRKAAVSAELALKNGQHAGFPQFQALQNIAYAQILIELAQYEKADEHLSDAAAVDHQLQSRLLRYFLLFQKSALEFGRKEEKSGLTALKQALAISRDQGLAHLLLDLPQKTSMLCTKAMQADIEVPHVQHLIKKHNILPQKSSLLVMDWPWKIKIFTLGRFSLVKDNEPVRFTRKAQQKPLLLLKALIALGGRSVRENRITDALWPDAEGDLAHKTFSTTLHRLRRLVGEHQTLEFRNGCLTLDQRYAWVDAWSFERILGKVDKLWEGSGRDIPPKAVMLSQYAITLYRGPFLTGELHEPWAIFFRERLRSKFLRVVGKLGLYWENCGQLDKAVECFQRSLEVDDLDEESYRRLMACYQRLGRRAKALDTYERCRKMLSASFGLAPSPETEILRKSILR